MRHDAILPLLFTTLFSGFAGGVIGSVVTYMFQSRLLNRQLAEQRRIASESLRLDLFDRRYKVFEAARKFLEQVFLNAGFDGYNSELTRFNLATSDAEFLFRSEVVNWLAAVRERANDLHATKKLLSRPPKDDAKLEKLANKESKAYSRLIDLSDAITAVFVSYLGFTNVSETSPRPEKPSRSKT